MSVMTGRLVRSTNMPPLLLSPLVALAFAAAPAPAADAIDSAWVVNRVSADGRTLVIYARSGGCDPRSTAPVTETPASVEIHAGHAPPPPSAEPCAANVRFERIPVRLKAPIAGRRLIGQTLDFAPVPERMPRMLGLTAKDARAALRAQGLRPTGVRTGTITWQTPWPGAAVPWNRPTKVYLSNPMPAAHAAARLRFENVARGDGAASTLRPRDGLVVGSEARWKPIWRKLTGSDDGRPRVDFANRRALVVLQGRKPSGGHEIRVTRVQGLTGRIVVDVRETSPGRGCLAAGVMTSPYHVVSIPRDDRPVEFVRTQRTDDCR
jgi:hypothetical protein